MLPRPRPLSPAVTARHSPPLRLRFAADVDREVRLAERKLAAGATFVQSQMCFDFDALRALLQRAGDLLDRVRFYGVAPLGNERTADHVRALASFQREGDESLSSLPLERGSSRVSVIAGCGGRGASGA